ncbi:MAG: hypothetical protein ACRCZI_02150 [Cetobacterium sp.]
MSFRFQGTLFGERYHAIAILTDNTPTVGYSLFREGEDAVLPKHVNRNDTYDQPVFLSPSRLLARRWVITNAGFQQQTMHPSYGRVEYVLMTAPNGTVYAYGLNDSGTFYLEPFDSKVPYDREPHSTLMHKGDLVWVADNRLGSPR